MILSEFDVDIMPVLTGAGIVGLAVGFGAQTLVKDLISGCFLIFENIVEAVNLRTVVSRDLEGIVRLP
jgi:small conductance mechanosensitive channel